MSEQIRVVSIVAGRRHDEHARVARAQEGIELRLREEVAAEAAVDDLRPLEDCKVHARYDRTGCEEALRVRRFDRHQANVPRHTDVWLAIVCGRADRARDVGAVAVVVIWIARAGESVDAENVVHKAIAVIVNPVSLNLTGVAPHLRSKIQMCVTDAGVQHRDDDVRAAHGDVPRVGDIDVRAAHAPELTVIAQAPKAAIQEKSVRRGDGELSHIVRLHLLELARLTELVDAISQRLRFLPCCWPGGKQWQVQNCPT